MSGRQLSKGVMVDVLGVIQAPVIMVGLQGAAWVHEVHVMAAHAGDGNKWWSVAEPGVMVGV